MEPAPVIDRLVSQLSALVGDRVTTSVPIRQRHGQDESYHAPHPPDAVVFPHATDEVVQIVRLCAAARMPIVPFGVGTSLEGNIAAVRGGVCLDMGQMNRILEVNREDLDCRVQPGVTRKQLNRELNGTGLFFPIDPGADATLGGMASTRGSGTMAVRYGTMRENVLGLEVVLADGRVIRTARRARKSAAGYDLTRLFVGAEGTLGVITEVTVRLHPVPEAISAAVCPFPGLEAAIETVISTVQMGIPVARIEILDEVMMDAVNRHSKLDYPRQPTLFFEFHGSESAVAEQAQRVGEIAREHGGADFRWAARPEDRSRLWHARDNTLYAALGLRPGARAMITDVCVPISRLAECMLATRADIDRSGLTVCIVGHVGDGNFHLLILVDPNDPEEIARATNLHDDMVMRALALQGTCTGEHGVGTGKKGFLQAELGEAVSVMRQVKRSLDPDGIMNPGKIFTD
ncbi:MAG TPA: FAD-linked oxidase C-terminal domain-containing protein [Burkholderiales bacterium]|nr:FAD-linked oxidase C-terminal domain-containing protein [Burkholderiales bacterium]